MASALALDVRGRKFESCHPDHLTYFRRGMSNKKTAGQQILEHDALRLSMDDDVIEYRKSMEGDVLKKIYDTAHQAKTQTNYTNKDFYVVLVITEDRVLRQPKIITLARQSCPTPVYKQSVWKFMHTTGTLEFLWTIPDQILYYHILRNKQKYLQDAECAQLAKFVILMESGELLEWIKKENGEKLDAVIKINQETEYVS